MRKLIFFILISAVISGGLLLARKSEAAVTTQIAPAGTSLSTPAGPLWRYSISATNCSTSSTEPYAFHTFDTTSGGDYTFTMNTSGFAGVIYVYRQLFVSTGPCTNIANNQDSSHKYITGSTLTLTLSASSRYVVVFSPANNFNVQNNSRSSSNVIGTFSASVSGPAAVNLVSNVTTTIAPANTQLNSQNYTWKYPIKIDCSSLSDSVNFVAYSITVPETGLYTFTMNTNGFAGVIHVYDSFVPNNQCSGFENPTDGLDNVVTGNSITVPINVFSSAAARTVVFSTQTPGAGGTFSASVTGPSQVTVLPAGDLIIASQPTSKSVTSGCQQALSVYATGPQPQTFQWYEGIAGDLTSSIMILGATSSIYLTPPLISDKSYWVRVTSGNDHVDSDTIAFKVYQTNKTHFSGSLDPNQTWNLMNTFCNPSGTFVHYAATQIRIPATGDYTVHVSPNSNFSGGYAIHLYDSFNATSPCGNFYDLRLNADLNTHLGAGTYTVVISATNPSEANGDFDASVSTIDDCSLPETVEQALLISGNPLDKAIGPGGSATLTFAYSGGSAKPKTLQWYQGFSGDTSHPIANATGTNYTTPSLNQSPPNQPTYYYYWARVTDSGQATYADTRTAIVNVLNPPVTYSDSLTQCDDVYPQVGGPITFYKIFPFTVSTSGAYTFNVAASGFTPVVRLYQGFFSPQFPNINYYGPGATQNILASPNIYYLVITTSAANQTGIFTLNITGPDLVVPTPRPIISVQPTDKIILRNQTTTLNVTSNTPDVSYQWYIGTCTNKTAVNGANSNTFTTPAMTDYQDFWVKVSYGVMYVNSDIAHVKIKPEAINDTYTIDEDSQLDVATLGVMANDRKADSKSIAADTASNTSFGIRTLVGNGALTYVPNSNKNGTDSFNYTVSDGILTSDAGVVAINVREINDQPVRIGGSVNDHTFTEDSAAAILHLGGVNYGPGGGTDEASQTLTYTVTAVPPVSVGQVTLANDTTVVTANTTYTLAEIREMKFKPAANGYGGPYPFTFSVTDNGTSRGVADPKTLSQSLNITVNAVADTPPATSATTNEDTQTTSGLVLNRNADDGTEVTHFQIIQIKNGTLYKNDGVTQIDKGEFITYGEGHAGLKFKPNANLSSPVTVFSFDFQASLSNSGQGLGGSPVTAAIMVNPVADLPTVTGATTFVNLQTNSGLVITRNQVDGSEIGFYKISSITSGTLYKSDGATQINAGQFITAAEGSAGLKFTPAQDSTASGTFQIQGSVDSSGTGLGPAATANVTVNKYNTSTTIASDSPAPSYLGQQITVSYSVQNTSGAPVPAGDVVVTVSGGAETCTGTVTAGSCTLTLNAGGNPRTITATYNGNDQFNSSRGTKDHVVNGCTQNTTVTSKADDGTEGTLRYIVDHACDGSTITFDPAVFDAATGPHNILLGTFGNIADNLLISKGLTIQGPGANILTVRRDPGSRTKHFRIFNIAAGATANISGLTISSGFANGGPGLTDADGGGILNAGTLTLQSCVVSGNQAGRTGLPNASGGGIYNSGALTLINSTVNGNKAFISNGGGILVDSAGTANIINSTISDNTAAGSGGGLAVSGSVNVLSSTIANNSGAVSAGGIYHELGTTSITNSIVAGNTSASGPDVVLLSGLINTGGHNLIGKNDGAESAFVLGSPNTTADIVGNSSSPILSLLGPLADNGGPTYTHLPLPGSPAINAGSNDTLPQDTLDTDGNGNTGERLPLDQRGQARIANATVDIGAVEVSYAITSTSGAGQSAVINTSFAAPLRAIVTESGRATAGAQVTFAGPGTGPGGSFNGNATVTVLTDNSGVAESPIFIANEMAGNYDVSAGLAGGISTSFGLTNTQGPAQVSLSNLNQTFDGAPRSVFATTIPSGLVVVLTYDGSITPPTNAGAYQVTATVSDPNYSGQAIGTLNVARANQTINFAALSNQTVGNAPFALSANATSGLPVSFNIVSGPASIAGNILTLSGPGTVVVRASQTGDANNNPAASADRSFDVNKIQATIALANLNQTYDGQAKNAVVTTNPPNLNVLNMNYSQNGVVVAAPTNAGSYEVTASLSNDSYQASDANGTLVIAKASQSISFGDLQNRTLGDADFAVSANASSGLAVSFAASGNCTMASNAIHLTGAGTCTVTVSQDGNLNYLTAGSVPRSFSIAKTSATITLGNLVHTYDGTAKAVSVSTNPGGLNVTLTYDGSASPPLSAGSYAVIGTINDPNYQGSTTEQLVINKATPALSWPTPSDFIYGIALGATQLNANSSVAGNFVYSPGAGTILNAGSGQTLTVNFTPADAANYNTASKTVSLNVAKANQTITFAALSNRIYGDAPFSLSATSSSGLDVSFSVLDGPATITGDTVSISGAGPVTIRASQAGNDNHSAAAVDRSFSVAKANQTITFAALPNQTYGDAPFSLSATSSSGLDVSFKVIEGPATISGKTVTVNGAGAVAIRASQPGDNNNNAAAAVDRTFSVSKANQTITFDPLVNRTYGDAPFPLSATSSSGMDVSFKVINGPATISGNTLTMNGAGSVTIRASQSGDNNNNAAAPIDRTFTIAKANQTITFASLPNRTYGDGPFTLSATASSGLEVSFSVIAGPATINGNTVSLSGAGSVTIRASQSGDNNNAAAVVDRTFTVSKADQTISFAIQNDKTFGDADFALSATASSNLTVSFAAAGNCTVTGTNVRLLGAGECTLTASQAGNDDYHAAPSVNQTFVIAKGATTTLVASSINPAGFGQTVTLTATVASSAGSPTGTVQFKDNETSLGTPVTVSPDGTATFDVSNLNAGTHTIRAQYSGDANFAASDGLLPGGQSVGDNSAWIAFSAVNYEVNESDGFVRIVVNRTGDAAPAITVDYATDNAGAPVDCSALNSGLANARCDFNSMFGRLTFAPNETQKTFDIPINMDSYMEGPEVFTITLSKLTSGASLATPSSATVTINDSPSSAANASDDTTTFVRQQYHDFLNREADPAGLAFWKNNIDKCSNPAQREPGQTLGQCIEMQRVLTSAAFFLSIEFSQTGGLVRDFYVAALDRPATNNMPALVEFQRDTQRIQQGVVVGVGHWQQTLNENRAAFMNDFVMRPEFVGLYPTTDSPAQYVDKLYLHAGVTPKSAQERNQTIAEFGAAPSADNAMARAEALLRVTQDSAFQARERNRAFVQIEYFGYLRRDPKEAPDRDFAGYDFWVTKLNQFDGDFLKAEMVKSFISSDEYRRRFGN